MGFEELLNQTISTRYTHTSQLVKARAVSALGGFGGNSSAPSSLTSQQGLQQVRHDQKINSGPNFLIIFSAVPVESCCGAHGRDPLWSLCHLQVMSANVKKNLS